MITLDIDLLELNDLYYAVGKHRMACEEQIREHGESEYFKSQLVRARELETIVQDALHNRVDELEEAIDFIDEIVEDDGPEYDSAGYSELDRIADAKYERAFSHFVDNDEADEDAGINQSENSKGVSQFILDFVEANDVVSYSEMNDMYKAYTKGSNSFSHILKALMIPYKNRPTRRYIKQIARGAYTVLIANPTNWVVVND